MNRLMTCIDRVLLTLWVCGVITLQASTPRASAQERQATPASHIHVTDGFRVELLKSASKDEGSWISMTFDDRGRLIVARDDVGLIRMTLDGSSVTKVESIEKTLKHCRGVLYAHESLYISATNSKGFYRFQDTDDDDQFDQLTQLRTLDYRSRYGHGSNQIVLGPDKQIYLVVGNDVSFPEGTDPQSPYRNPQLDLLLPDPRDTDQDNRVGYILRVDPEGKTYTVIAGGLRNQVDIAFNEAGEMFTYDADMEWDVGQPWYRPTRVNHVVSGGEYGWRWGSCKWRNAYPDSLPSNLDLGLGSPTGMTFGTASNWPKRFKQALYLADWQNGRILLADLKAEGASYVGGYKVFIEGGPLNICDMTFGQDGSLYFITGGRGSQSGLYRVSYVDASEPYEPNDSASAQAARKLRHELERFHTTRSAAAIERVWPHLSSSDHWIRFAARIALENQDVDQWRSRALAETNPLAATHALMALARCGTPADQVGIIKALNRLQFESAGDAVFSAAVRTYQLALIRFGTDDKALMANVSERLAPLYPANDPVLDQELARVLGALKVEGSVPATLKLLETAGTQEQQIHYAQVLSRQSSGWTLPLRKKVFAWVGSAKGMIGGKTIKRSLERIRDDLLAGMTTAEQEALTDEIEAVKEDRSAKQTIQVATGNNWSMDDLGPNLQHRLTGRSFESGRAALVRSACLVCHRIGTEGGQIGPDLTNAAGRFDARSLLESIIEPSKQLDPKYRFTTYKLDDGSVITGRPVGVNRKTITVETNALSQSTVSVERSRVTESTVSGTSPMPAGLINALKRDEVLDLLA